MKKANIRYLGILGAWIILSALCLLWGGCSDEETNLTAPDPVDDPWTINLERENWSWASSPYLGKWDVFRGDTRIFDPEDRVETVRWFQPRTRTLARHLDPDLINLQRDRTVPTMDLYLRAEDGSLDSEDWGGIMCGISRVGQDLSAADSLEIWVNDFEPDPSLRQGRIHIDFGYISEDGFWPLDSEGKLIVGTWEREDGILPGEEPDGVFIAPVEDIGLDGDPDGPQKFDPAYEIRGDIPYPGINGTSRNNREDSEDINGDTWLGRDNGYFTMTIDLQHTPALTDVVMDYENVADLIGEKIAWRKYCFSVVESDVVSVGTVPNLKAVTHVRIWYENPGNPVGAVKWLQFAGLRFVDDPD